MDYTKELLSCLRFSRDNGLPLRIESVNGKIFTIRVSDFDGNMVLYRFSNGHDGKIRLANIHNWQFVCPEDREKFDEQQAEQYFSVAEPGKRLSHFRRYYQEILEKIQKKFAPGSFEHSYYDFKIRVYNQIFQGLIGKKDNLLLNYFLGADRHLTDQPLSREPILLLQQSNLSQKKAVEAALVNRVSIIEGPPGTGKTTTILSIIANMVYRKQRVLVVSKNNSAIDNVAEELGEIGLSAFYVRLGSEKRMKAEEAGLKEKMREYAQALAARREELSKEAEPAILRTEEKVSALEEQLNRLIAAENELNELKNQMRHLEKRREAYGFDKNEKKIGRRVTRAEKAKRKLDLLADLSVIFGRGEKPGLFRQLLLLFTYQESLSRFKERGVHQMLFLEEEYLRLRIAEVEEELQRANLEELKARIKDIYLKEYLPLSGKMVKAALSGWTGQDLVTSLCEKIEYGTASEDGEGIMKEVKDELIALYPVILTTVDAVQSNFYHYIKEGLAVDCIVIDEASQCDILSALPLLYLAKRIVVVGDSKQLEAIKGLEASELETEVESGWDYLGHSFLTTISETLHPASNMLMEHYRCDYNIINYCNKYFYDNKLLIYRDASEHAMGLIDDDKGKYVEKENGSFHNDRELEIIRRMVGDEAPHTFIITPYKRQAEKLSCLYNERQCGTIHTFQGKGEREVYFSAVLNDTEEARKHLSGEHNLFGRELINVAVSRAKDRFIMVADVDFFKKHDENMTNLIEYIETYGERIPDKTVCLFDYLYRQMPVYQISGKAENPFEEQLQRFLEKYLAEKEEFECVMKMPLAAVVTDKTFLEEQPGIKTYIENHAHLDFLIYDRRVNRPALAIELDGKYHQDEAQKERDRKKEEALSHMEIPLWRIRSKEAWTEERMGEELEKLLSNGCGESRR